MFALEQLSRRGNGFLPGYLGIVITRAARNELHAELEVKPHHIAPNGYLHAGTVATFALFRCTQLVLHPKAGRT